MASQRQEVLRPLDRRRHLPQQLLQILVALYEINLRSIHDQQIRRRVVKEKVFVRLDHFFQIVFVDRFSSRRILLFQALLQHFGRGLQVNDEIRCGQLLAEMVVVAVIDFEFLIVQVEAGENLVLLEDKVGDYGFLRAWAQVEGAKLLEAANHESKLRLEAGPRLAFVEGAEEGIVLRLHNLLRVETLGKDPRQRALANSYGTFDCNITGQLKKISHWLEGRGIEVPSQHISLGVCKQLWKELTGARFYIANFRLIIPTCVV